jgi:hypothetical protein
LAPATVGAFYLRKSSGSLAIFAAIRVTGVTAFGRDLNNILHQLWGGLIMPTDLGDKAQARQAQATFNAIVLICFIICLGVLVLLVYDQSFSKAAVELMSLF